MYIRMQKMILCNHRSYSFLDYNWLKYLLFSTNLLAELLRDSLLWNSLLSHNNHSNNHLLGISKMEKFFTSTFSLLEMSVLNVFVFSRNCNSCD